MVLCSGVTISQYIVLFIQNSYIHTKLFYFGSFEVVLHLGAAQGEELSRYAVVHLPSIEGEVSYRPWSAQTLPTWPVVFLHVLIKLNKK